MDINTIVQSVSTIGFPITACIAMFYLYNKILTELVPLLNKMNDTLEMIAQEHHDKC